MKKEKCHLFRTGVKFLGYMVTREGCPDTSERTGRSPIRFVLKMSVKPGRLSVWLIILEDLFSILPLLVNPDPRFFTSMRKWNGEGSNSFRITEEHPTSDPVVAPYVPGAER